MKKIIVLTGAFMFIFSAVSFAQITKKEVATKQVNQQKRIQQGLNSGELTKREFVNLQKQQKVINKTKKAALADGVVTKMEKHKIKTKQVVASKNIAVKKHNRKDRN